MTRTRTGTPWARLGLLIAALVGCNDAPPAGPVAREAPKWTAQRRAEVAALELQLEAMAVGASDRLRVHLAFGPEATRSEMQTTPPTTFTPFCMLSTRLRRPW